MKVIAVVSTFTQNYRRRFAGPEPLEFRFGGQPLLAHVFTTIKSIKEIAEIWFIPPAGTRGESLRQLCATMGVHYYERVPDQDRLNLLLQVAAETDADHALLFSGYSLFLDPVLAAEVLARHLAANAARTSNDQLPVGLTPIAVSLSALRRLMARFNLSFDSPPWPLSACDREPAAFPTATTGYPGVLPAGEIVFTCCHAAQAPGFTAAWEAVGGKGTAALFDYVDAHPEHFSAFPKQVQVELTARCNHHCVFCPHDQRSFQGDMEPAIFARILDGLGWARAGGIDLAGYGEPMLHPRFWELLALAGRRAIPVHLYTNGTQWQPGTAQRLLDSGIQGIIFGIDAATPETYRKVRGADGLEAVTANITELLRLKQGKMAPIVAVQIVKSKLNNGDLEAFWDQWCATEKFERMRLTDYDFTAESGRLRLQSIEIERENTSEAERKQKLGRSYRDYYARYWSAFYRHAELPLEHVVIQRCNDFAGQLEDRRVVDFTPLKRCPCRQVAYGLMVLADGTVVPCQQDFNGKLAVGNLRETDLVTLWNSAPMQRLQRDQREGRYETNPLCARCRDWFIPMV